MHQKRAQKPRGGQVGQARVYTQAEVELVWQQEEVHIQGLANQGWGHDHGQGGRGSCENVFESLFVCL
jgi:hypothetical protein